MDGKHILTTAALFGISGGIVWASLPPALTLSADERAAIESSVTYSGCNEVRALGKAPVRAGEPGYRATMDGDADGLACEPHL